nr:MAG TPA: hypothetical protein [Caudoviricetes sp.]DAH61174.1 MAG TPA: hypothetical protein [Caudoviricetes sp.]
MVHKYIVLLNSIIAILFRFRIKKETVQYFLRTVPLISSVHESLS